MQETIENRLLYRNGSVEVTDTYDPELTEVGPFIEDFLNDFSVRSLHELVRGGHAESHVRTSFTGNLGISNPNGRPNKVRIHAYDIMMDLQYSNQVFRFEFTTFRDGCYTSDLHVFLLRDVWLNHEVSHHLVQLQIGKFLQQITGCDCILF